MPTSTTTCLSVILMTVPATMAESSKACAAASAACSRSKDSRAAAKSSMLRSGSSWCSSWLFFGRDGSGDRLRRRGFGVVGGFGRRCGLRRGFKRWGFQFGVQRSALGLFRMGDVCHSRQLRDLAAAPGFRPAAGNQTDPAVARSQASAFFVVSGAGMEPGRGSRRSSGSSRLFWPRSRRSIPWETVCG